MAIRFKYDVGAAIPGAFFAGAANAQREQRKYAMESALQQQRYGMQANARRQELALRAGLGGLPGVPRLGGTARAGAAAAPEGRWIDPTDEAPGDSYAQRQEKRRKRYEREKANRAGEWYGEPEWMPKWEPAPGSAEAEAELDRKAAEGRRIEAEIKRKGELGDERRKGILGGLPAIPVNASPDDQKYLRDRLRAINDILYSDKFDPNDSEARVALDTALDEYHEKAASISRPDPNEGALVQRPDGGFDVWEPGMGKPTHWNAGPGKEPTAIQDPAQEAAEQAAAEQQAQLEEQQRQQEEAAKAEQDEIMEIAGQVRDSDDAERPISAEDIRKAQGVRERQQRALRGEPDPRNVQGPQHAANLVEKGTLEPGAPIQYPDGSFGVAPGGEQQQPEQAAAPPMLAPAAPGEAPPQPAPQPGPGPVGVSQPLPSRMGPGTYSPVYSGQALDQSGTDPAVVASATSVDSGRHAKALVDSGKLKPGDTFTLPNGVIGKVNEPKPEQKPARAVNPMGGSPSPAMHSGQARKQTQGIGAKLKALDKSAWKRLSEMLVTSVSGEEARMQKRQRGTTPDESMDEWLARNPEAAPHFKEDQKIALRMMQANLDSNAFEIFKQDMKDNGHPAWNAVLKAVGVLYGEEPHALTKKHSVKDSAYAQRVKP